jgi:DNA-binding NarL/FixJ family response regulator
VLEGRERETARLERFLDAVHAATGPGLVVRGPAGSGKSALLAVAREGAAAAGAEVLATAGVDAPGELPFVGLLDITRPLVGRFGGDVGALRGAVALERGSGDDLAVADAFLDLLLSLSRERPVLVLVDDAHVLDPASAFCVDFAVGRVAGARVGFLMAARDDDPLPAWLEPLASMDVGPLDEASARAVLATTAPDLRSTALEVVIRWAAGNALALRQLPDVLTDAERRGVIDHAEPLRPPRQLQLAIERRIARLDDSAQRALLVVAAAHSHSYGEMLAAIACLGVDGGALSRAEDAGLLTVDHEGVHCAHPLVRATAYHRGGPSTRRAAHRALADSLTGAERAWHLALCATGPDEQAAAALEVVGADASARSAWAAATSAFETAARLSDDIDAREHRLVLAAEAAVTAGNSETALDLIAEVRPERRNVPRAGATAAHLAGLAMVGLPERLRDGLRQLRDTASEEPLPVRAAVVASDAAFASILSGDLGSALDLSSRAIERLGDHANPLWRVPVLATRAAALAYSGPASDALPLFDEIDRLVPQLDPGVATRHLSRMYGARLVAGDLQSVSAMIEGAQEVAWSAGAHRVAATLGVHLADACYRQGDWDRCEGEAHRSVDRYVSFGERTGQLLASAILARVLAARGEEEQTRALVADLLTTCEPARVGTIAAHARSALGLLELGLGAIDAAVTALEPACVLIDGFAPSVFGCGADLVEAYVMVGRVDDARALNGRMRQLAERSHDRAALAACARGDGLVGDADVDAAFGCALRAYGELSMPFERARTHLAYGARLHRANRRAVAREVLGAARDAFERLGARPWTRRANAELAAAGERTRGSTNAAVPLTEREQSIAGCVANGLTNREIAAELFLSVKTVEFHLGRIFDKLGVRSRTQVATAVLRAGATRDA